MSTALEVLWPAVNQARWFAGKSLGGEPVGHTALAWLPHAAGQWPLVRTEFVEVAYPDGTRETYQLPLAYRPTPGPHDLGRLEVTTPDSGPQTLFACDATGDPEAMAIVWAAFLSSSELDDGQQFSCWRPDLLPASAPPARRHTGEQSNTSVFFPDVAMCKIFRKVDPGPNLDIEVHEALRGTGAVATLHGRYRVGDTDLAMLVEMLPQPIDGYELACSHVAAGRDFRPHAADLGTTLAHVHHTLADSFGTATLTGAQVAETFEARLTQAVGEVAELAPYADGLRRVHERLRDQSLVAQQVHGDFHLGQTLLTPDGWRIVDFEGEPLKTPAERREPDSPWRDVAGMLRSFDYAALSTAGPDSEDASVWARDAREAFLRAYGEAMGTRISPALAAYEADKATYELRYETRNRPQLVAVPLHYIATTALEDDNGH